MEDINRIIILYDYYEVLLTESQKEYFEDYYFNNLSLSEIAENKNVSRNAVHNQIKNTVDKINNYEDKLKIYEKNKKVEALILDNKIKEEVMKKEKKIMPTKNLEYFTFNGTFTSPFKLPTFFDKNQIKDVIFNDPATIVLWKDGTKTVVKCQKNKGDTYNPELGLAMCIIKKMCDNKGNYNDVFNEWLPTEDK
jgi:predicted DNA-binding protein YlxM (UPF0122 family)